MSVAVSQQEGGVNFRFAFHEKAGVTGSASGTIDHEDEYRNAYNNAGGANQVSVLHSKKYTLAASGTQALDLSAIVDDIGNTRAFTKIYSWYFEVKTRLGKVYVKQGATNPWSALISEDSDVAADSVPRLAAQYGAIAGDSPDGLVVSSTSKNIILENASSTDAVEIIVHFAGI